MEYKANLGLFCPEREASVDDEPPWQLSKLLWQLALVTGPAPRIIRSMKTLVDTNVYLHDPLVRRRMLVHSAMESSIFEGATGLRKALPAKGETYVGRSRPRRRRSTSATKVAAKGS
jgi:hypothetical protein